MENYYIYKYMRKKKQIKMYFIVLTITVCIGYIPNFFEKD